MIEETEDRGIFDPLKRLIGDQAESLLDIGCGTCQLSGKFEVPVVIVVDAHRPYLINREDRSPRIIPLHMDALKLEQHFIPRSISTVLLTDVIEHFYKHDALKLLESSERIAYDRVIVFTPRGYFPQQGYDHYEMNGESYQEHRSGWEPEELEQLGYHVTVIKGLHGPENMSFLRTFGPDHPRIDAILAYKDIPKSNEEGGPR